MSILKNNRKIILKKLHQMLYPFIIQGLEQIYKEAKSITKDESDCLKNFQILLQKVKDWDDTLITNEMGRILLKIEKGESDNTNNIVVKFVRMYLKLLILELTSIDSKAVMELEMIEVLDLKQFIHKLYIAVSREIFTVPYLFYDKLSPIEYLKNKQLAIDIIEKNLMGVLSDMIPWEEVIERNLSVLNKEIFNNLNPPRPSLSLMGPVPQSGGNLNPGLPGLPNFNELEYSHQASHQSKNYTNLDNKMITPSKLPRQSPTDKSPNPDDLDDKDREILNIINKATKDKDGKIEEKPEGKPEEKAEENPEKKPEEKSKDDKTSENSIAEEKVVKIGGGGANSSSINKIMNDLKESDTSITHIPESEDGYSGYAEVFTNKNINTEEKKSKLSKNKYFSNYLKV